MDMPVNFTARLERVGECLEFTGHRVKGYGHLTVDSARWSAHRLAWTLAFGPIPEGMLVCHRCDNPPCCEPTHLFLGTVKDNAVDRASKGRNPDRRGEANGNHRLTVDQVRQIRLRAAQGVNQEELAQLFGVRRLAINRIVTGRRWTQVA